MTTSLTLKAIIGVAVTTIISIITYSVTEKTVEVTQEPVMPITKIESQRLNDTDLNYHEPWLYENTETVEVIELLPDSETLEYVEVTAEEVIVNADPILASDITCIIYSCGWSCGGSGCRVSECYVNKIEEQPIEEEESILSEQIFTDLYIFEAKAYPNPTRDNTTIELDIEISSNFTIQLFDMNGRLVEQIYDGQLESGRQSFNTDLYEYMPGLYFISIQSLFQQETLKIQKIG